MLLYASSARTMRIAHCREQSSVTGEIESSADRPEQRRRYALGQRVVGTIERIVPGGFGLLRGDHGIVLVESAASGDRLEVSIDSFRGGVARGTITRVLESGAGRTIPVCPLVPACGGCDFQHLTYDAQVAAKVEMLRDALRRVGRIDLPADIEIVPADAPFGQRDRVEFHYDDRTKAFGFFGRRSNDVVDVDHCPVVSPEIGTALGHIRQSADPKPGSIRVVSAHGTVRAEPATFGLSAEPMVWSAAGIDYLIDPATFTQGSLGLVPNMIETVVGHQDSSNGVAWDLFCGSGLFTLPLARHWDDVIGVEIDRQAIRNAKMSAHRNAISNARFFRSRVDDWLRQHRQRRPKPSLVVVDPPRSGLGADVSRMLTRLEPKRLTYVSCDPVSLARDLRVLVQSGYAIEHVSLFDMFPQTHHLETIVRLARS